MNLVALTPDALDEYHERASIMGEHAETEDEWAQAQRLAYSRVCYNHKIRPEVRQGELF